MRSKSIDSATDAQNIRISYAGAIQPSAKPITFVSEVTTIEHPTFSKTVCNLKGKSAMQQ